MAKYSVVPGGRIDNVVQGAKAIGRSARSGAAMGGIMGVTTAMENPLGAAAIGAALGGAVGAVGGAAKQLKQHHALRKEQFRG